MRDQEPTLPLAEAGVPAWRSRLDPADLDLTRGTTVGRFVLLDLLGRGGAGYVFVAYDPVHDRKVALKLLRAELGAGVLVREAQALAHVAHPAIARVHEAGRAGDRVWIAMALVEGTPLREWLAAPRPWREVLAVFLAAGEGLAALHAAGLVHRSFKPESVLVDRDGRARVTGFGLAAAIPAGPGGRAPRYLAPEQLAEPTAEIDAGADQFAFCVALHEALFGYPFEDETPEAIRRRVLAGELAPPAAGSAAPRRLRAVLAVGLRPAPADRHPSMAALLAALAARRRARWPIAAALGAVALAAGAVALAAGRPDRGAACRADAARLATAWDDAAREGVHRALSASGRGHAEETWGRVRGALDRYAAALGEAQRDACDATFARREQSAALLGLRTRCLDELRGELSALAAALALGGPEVADRAVEAAGRLPAVARCADASALRGRPAPPADPFARARLAVAAARRAEAHALAAAGRGAEAQGAVRGALLAARAAGDGPLEADAALLGAELADAAGRHDDAEAALGEAARIAARAGDDRRVAGAFAQLAAVIGVRRARFAEGLVAADAAEVALLRVRETPGAAGAGAAGAGARDDAAARARIERVRGALHRGAGELERARASLEAAAALAERLELPLELAATLDDLGDVYRRLERGADAEARHTRALALEEGALGPQHPDVGRTLVHLGRALSDLGRADDARAAFRRAESILAPAYGERDAAVASAVSGIADTDRAAGRLAEAAAGYRRAEAISTAVLGPRHADTGDVVERLGDALADAGDHAAAEQAYRRALEIFTAAYGPDHHRVGTALLDLGAMAARAGRFAEADGQLRRALDIYERALGVDHPRVALALVALAGVAALRGRCADADPLYRRAYKIWDDAYGPADPRLAPALAGLGECALAARRPADAVSLLEHALALAGPQAVEPAALAAARFGLARALRETGGDLGRAADLARQAEQGFAAAHWLVERDRARAWLAALGAP